MGEGWVFLLSEAVIAILYIMDVNQNFLSIIKKYRWFFLVAIVLIVIPAALTLLSSLSQLGNGSNTQQSFTIISTTPKDGAINVSSGEITISFTADVQILSKDSFSITISPAVPESWELTNAFPTQTIVAQVYGGLALNTIYTVTVEETANGRKTVWKFRTADTPAESSTGFEVKKNNQLVQDYYPLAHSVPYETRDFSIDYTDRLALEVKIRNSNVERVKRETEAWIRSQGVDPATHTINYINDF